MGTSKKLVNYHLNRLKDKSAEVRLAAIEELGKLGDIDALEQLEQVYKNDQDEAVRAAAREAGRVIYFKNNEQDEAE